MRIEIAATFCTTDRQCCQRILENLFKTKELENRQINCRMETKTTLIWTKCTIELNSVATVDMRFASIICPSYTEHNLSFRFNNSFEKRICFVFRMCIDNRCDRCQNFSHSLKKFWLIGILFLCFFDYSFNICVHVNSLLVFQKTPLYFILFSMQ